MAQANIICIVFGSSSARKSADPVQLYSEFAAAGVVMPEEMQEFQARFDAAKAIITGA